VIVGLYVPPGDPMPRVVLVRGDAEVASWAIPAGQNLDLAAVDRLARLQLAARRAGYSLRLRGAPSRLRELLDLAGLSDIVTDAAGPVSTDPDGPAGGHGDGGTSVDEPG
jgi:STAS domain